MRAPLTMLSKIPLFPRVVSLHVVGWALLFFVFPLWLPQTDTSFAAAPPVKKVTLSVVGQPIIRGEPNTFRVDRLGINLPVISGTYDQTTSQWTLSDTAVQFAAMTMQPNDRSGNTLLYGHNTWSVLSPMGAVVPGDLVAVTTTNGHTFTYAYTNDAIVPPDMTSILYDNPNKPRLTVMTCEGIWSQARRLMYFDLVEVS